jgi:hypothetical protein
MQDMKDEFSKVIEIPKNQNEILEMKGSISQLKTSIKSLTNRVEQDEREIKY